MRRLAIPVSCCFAVGLVLAGCAEGPVKADPKVVAELRQRLLLDAEPSDPLTPLDWRDRQASADANTDDESDDEAPASSADAPVVLVGQVGGMPNPWGKEQPDFPWKRGVATFFLVDPSVVADFADHVHKEGEEDGDCPFCAREATEKADGVAAVNLLGADGKTAAVDVRELVDVKEGDVVVVRGKATLLGGELLVLDADGVFVRR
ncbi:MAG: hypothetical protein ACRCT8_07130 [Lacipirellulaceae bacterium]